MKKILLALTIAVSTAFSVSYADTAAKKETAVVEKKDAAVADKKAPETKRVCIKVLDNKTNKEVEKCRVMKVHEKHEGTKVPTK